MSQVAAADLAAKTSACSEAARISGGRRPTTHRFLDRIGLESFRPASPCVDPGSRVQTERPVLTHGDDGRHRHRAQGRWRRGFTNASAASAAIIIMAAIVHDLIQDSFPVFEERKPGEIVFTSKARSAKRGPVADEFFDVRSSFLCKADGKCKSSRGNDPFRGCNGPGGAVPAVKVHAIVKPRTRIAKLAHLDGRLCLPAGD